MDETSGSSRLLQEGVLLQDTQPNFFLPKRPGSFRQASAKQSEIWVYLMWFFFFLTLSNAERDTTLLWHGQLRKEPWHIFEHEQSERHLLWEAFRFSVQKLTLLGCVSGLEQSISPTQTRYLTRCSACSLLLCGSTLRIPRLQLSLWLIKQRDDQKFLWGFTASHRFLTVCTNSR